jgi:LmbE family N-acetylglucosaminyl deacetylase
MLPARLCNILVLSPHCDDAVFACGALLESHPRTLVATIFAGRPPADFPLTEWDQAAGFGPRDDIMGMRRAEDREALTTLGAIPLWLDFLDSQYRPRHTADDLGEAVEQLLCLCRPSAVVAPLGLFHDDHRAVHQAALRTARRHAAPIWFLYEDANYRLIPGLTARRLSELTAEGWALHDASFPTRPDASRKKDAVHAYASQLRALASKGRPGHSDALAAERYWRITWTQRT